MKKYLILHHWYENVSQGIIEADDEYNAIKIFVKHVHKLDSNYELEEKYGYVSTSLFYYDEEEETFDSAFERYYGENSSLYDAIELKQDIVGVITDKGFYNGEDN